MARREELPSSVDAQVSDHVDPTELLISMEAEILVRLSVQYFTLIYLLRTTIRISSQLQELKAMLGAHEDARTRELVDIKKSIQDLHWAFHPPSNTSAPTALDDDEGKEGETTNPLLRGSEGHVMVEYKAGEGYSGRDKRYKRCFVCNALGRPPNSAMHYCQQCQVPMCRVLHKDFSVCWALCHQHPKVIEKIKIKRESATVSSSSEAMTDHHGTSSVRRTNKKRKSSNTSATIGSPVTTVVISNV